MYSSTQLPVHPITHPEFQNTSAVPNHGAQNINQTVNSFDKDLVILGITVSGDGKRNQGSSKEYPGIAASE
jgi:hypothetical protein